MLEAVIFLPVACEDKYVDVRHSILWCFVKKISVLFGYIFCIIHVLSRNQSPIRCSTDDVTIAYMSTTTACAVSRVLVSLFCWSSMMQWS